MNNRFSLIIKGAALSLIITLMLALLLSAAIYVFDIADGVQNVLIFAIAALSCLFGAYAACTALESKGLLTGGAIGIIYYILLAIAASIVKKELSIDPHSLIMLVCASASGMLGGIFGIQK